MNKEEILGRVENILFAAGDSFEISRLAELLNISLPELNDMLDEDIRRREQGQGLLIRRFDGKVQLSTRQELSKLLFMALGKKSDEELPRRSRNSGYNSVPPAYNASGYRRNTRSRLAEYAERSGKQGADMRSWAQRHPRPSDTLRYYRRIPASFRHFFTRRAAAKRACDSACYGQLLKLRRD